MNIVNGCYLRCTHQSLTGGRHRGHTRNLKNKTAVTDETQLPNFESAFSFLYRGIIGTCHRVSAKHLHAYLNEMCFRFDDRKNLFLFRDTVLKLVQSPNLEYGDFTKSVA